MAIVRLTDIVTTMKDKWVYGDKFFGYTEEFNDNHNTQYPSLLITPPDSVYPEVTPRNGWEEYSFEVYFSDLYNRTEQANESIEQRWDNLQDLANEWLDMFLKSYIGEQDGKTTISYLTDGSLTIERNKDVANDQLLQIKMNFGWKIFSKCFTPVSNYPNEIADLKIWLSADSNVTFSIPTKRVSAWGDRSGNNNNVAQATSDSQPLRYTFKGGSDVRNVGDLDGKTRFVFDESKNQNLKSTTPANNPLLSGDFTIFIASNYKTNVDTDQESIFALEPQVAGLGQIQLGQKDATDFKAQVSDGTTALTANVAIASISETEDNIMSYKLNADTMTLYLNGRAGTPVTDAAFNATAKFVFGNWYIGGLPTIATSFFDGSVAEVIVYDRALSDIERNKVEDYLNKKYRIY